MSQFGLSAFASRERIGGGGQRPQRGTSLHELLVVLSLFSITMPLMFGWLHHAFTWSQETERWLQQERTLTRLADQLRRDIRQARSARPAAATQGKPPGVGTVFIELERPDGTAVQYASDDDRLSRIVTRQGVALARDDFLLAAVQVSTAPSRWPDQVTVELAIPQGPVAAGRTARSDLHIESPVGGDMADTQDGSPRSRP
jgi:hypothetical protein